MKKEQIKVLETEILSYFIVSSQAAGLIQIYCIACCYMPLLHDFLQIVSNQLES